MTMKTPFIHRMEWWAITFSTFLIFLLCYLWLLMLKSEQQNHHDHELIQQVQIPHRQNIFALQFQVDQLQSDLAAMIVDGDSNYDYKIKKHLKILDSLSHLLNTQSALFYDIKHYHQEAIQLAQISSQLNDSTRLIWLEESPLFERVAQHSKEIKKQLNQLNEESQKALDQIFILGNERNHWSQITIALIMGISILGAIIGTLVLYRLTKDIRQLAALTNQVSEGNLEIVIPINRKDDFGILQANFAQMQSKLFLLVHQLELQVANRTQEYLIASQKAQAASLAKSAFVANMSHEIRTPLNAVLGIAHLLDRRESDPTKKDYLAKLDSAGKALLSLLNDVLDLSKIESDQLQLEEIEFSLEKLLTDLGNIIALQAHTKDLEFSLRLDPQLPDMVWGDKTRLNQILLNLCSNAIKFTQHGELSVNFTLRQWVNEKQFLLEVQVKDTGKGIDTNHLDAIFEAFHQEDISINRKFGGTGLGLSISRKLARLMSGDLRVESQPNLGSTFFFTCLLKVSSTQKPKWTLIQDQLKGMRILVAEDHELSRLILEEYLHNMGFQVDSVDNGIDALAYWVQSNHAYQLVLLDWQMPGMDGICVAREILTTKGVQPPIIIMVTAYDREEILKIAQGLPLDHFISKPVQPSTLFDRLIQVLANRITIPWQNPITLTDTELHYILVVEDNEINQLVVKEVLQAEGYEVEICNHGLEAIEWLKLHGESKAQAILMDVQMPVMNGIDATKYIRQELQFTRIPIFALSADVQKDTQAELYKAGINLYLSKPIDPQILLKTLRDRI